MNAAIAVKVNDSSSLKWAFDYHVHPEDERRPAILLGCDRVPPWAYPVVARITELARLPMVDPRGSRPINPDDIIDALSFLRHVMRDDTSPPWIGRLSTGGVQLTWRSGDTEVEAVFDRARGDREVMVSVGENEWEAPANEAESLFGTVADRLSLSHVEYATIV